MMRIAKGLAVLSVLLLSATSAMAAGFRLPTAGAKAMGMGFAFTAQADDPSAIYFNPAGIAQLEGNNVMVGGTYIRENGGEFTGTTALSGGAVISETQKDLDFFVPNLYFTRKATPDIAYGIGVFSPFGLGLEYNDRDRSFFRNVVSKVEIQTVVVNPTVAWKVNEVLYVGGGIDFMYGRAELQRTGVVNNTGNPLSDNVANQVNLFKLDLDGDGTAWGYNFGALILPAKNVKIGFAYRSPFTLKIKDADADVNDISNTPLVFAGGASGQTPTVISAAGGPTFRTKASTVIHFPATAALGIAYSGDRLTVETDLDWTFWHSLRRLDIDINENAALLRDIQSDKNWRDVVAFRVGAEYRVTDPLALRLGFAYDQTPVPAETMDAFLPDADRMTYHAGVGYKLAKWTVDAAYYYVDKKDRTVNNQVSNATTFPGFGTGFNGTWKGDAHLVGLDVGYRF